MDCNENCCIFVKSIWNSAVQVRIAMTRCIEAVVGAIVEGERMVYGWLPDGKIRLLVECAAPCGIVKLILHD